MQPVTMTTSTLGSINHLPEVEKREIYTRLIPPEILSRFNIPKDYKDPSGRDLLIMDCARGSTTTELRLYHQAGFPDPLLHGEITGTFTGLVHILIYILNDPASSRFDIDRMPDGSLTHLGAVQRNLEAELAALRFGLTPGQIRRGLRLLGSAISTFEAFITSLGQDMFLAEPLYYHNAVLFERYGFTYERGKRLMQRIQEGFLPGGDLATSLDGSTPFRSPEAAESIRLRSWAIHDGILGEPFTGVTMYKRVNKNAGICTCPNCCW